MSNSTPTRKRRKPAFTKAEITSTSEAAEKAGIETWALERKDMDGTVTRFICGVVSSDNGQSEWDKHEAR